MENKDEIRELIERYLNNQASLYERARIDSWIENDRQLNRWLTCRIENSSSTLTPETRQRLNDAMAEIMTDSIEKGTTSSDIIPDEKMSNRRKHDIRLWSIAASVTIIAILAGIVLFPHEKEQKYSQPLIVSTNAGERSRVTLPDGSSLTLNHLSEIQYHYDESMKQRILALNGEAAFDVETDPEHPFIVTCDGLRIECRGTSFNVKGYPEENNVTVVLSDGVITASTNRQSITMKPGNKVRYDKHSRNMHSTMVDASEYTDWTNGGYRYNDDILDDILRSISRQYDVNISLLTPSLRNVRLSGSIGRKTLEETLGIIAAASDAKYMMESDSTICFYREP